jgi:glycosyltransferase involved in cell wall biosynthesis
MTHHILSLVIPIYNEEKNLNLLYQKIKEALGAKFNNFEIIFIDDGSQDQSFTILKEIAKNDTRVRVLRLARNFGQTAAMMAGIDESRGDLIVTLDGDLQNDPGDIEKMVKKIDEGYDVVSGWRKKRNDAFLNRRLPSHIANWLISYVTGMKLHDYGCTLKVYRKSILENVRLYGEMHRFIPALVFGAGGKIVEMEVNHLPRIYEKTKYGIGRTFKVVLDLLVVKFLTKYSTRPMHFFGGAGIWSFLLGGIVGVWALALKLFEGKSFISTPLPLLAVFFVLIGLQFVLMGLLAEMITRIYFETENHQIYKIKEKIN